MKYGEKIREIRISKRLSQKEVYWGILSKSYAIEFEKGKHNISAVLLIEILEQLFMDIDEFMYIYEAYHLNERSEYIERYAKYSNSHDLPGLYELLHELEQKDSYANTVRKAEVRARIKIISHINETGLCDAAVVDKEDRRIIIRHLSNLGTWTLQEIQLYTNTLEFIDFETQLIFFKRISKTFLLYENFEPAREIFCSLLINLIRETLLNDLLDFADVLILQLLDLSTDYRQFFHRVCGKFYQLVLMDRRGNEDKRVEAKKLLKFLEALDHQYLSKELEILLK